MTTQEQIAANGNNARKSTGPKTQTGKLAVAQNARRHGATRAPGSEQIADWFRVIMGAPDLAPNAMLKDDDTTRLALRLADAEARLVHAETALDAFEKTPTFQNLQPEVTAVAHYMLMHFAGEIGANNHHYPKISDELAIQSILPRPEVLVETARQHRLLQRYLREASGQRNRAFKAWIGCLMQT